jgi:hypothetical protein
MGFEYKMTGTVSLPIYILGQKGKFFIFHVAKIKEKRPGNPAL